MVEANIKNINDIEELLKIRKEIQDKINDIKTNDGNLVDMQLLQKKYFNISNKVYYLKNKQEIIEKYDNQRKEYVKNNYEVIKQKNKDYQAKRRAKFKEMEKLVNSFNPQ